LDLLAGDGRLLPTSVWNLRVWPGWERLDPVPIANMHLLLVRAGAGTYWVDDREISLVPGRVVFLGRGVGLRFSHDRDNPPEIIPCRFDVIEESGRTAAPALEPFVLSAKADDFTAYLSLFHEAYLAFGDGSDPAGRTAAASALHLVIARLYRQLIGSNPAEIDPRIRDILWKIDTEPLREARLAELAADVDLSPEYLSRLFKRTVGETLSAYQHRKRMEYAHHLLSHPSATVQDVSEILGYSDPSVFSRQYKKALGHPPSAARNRRW
jgi:AraC-like DNA-binding protein